MKNKNVKMGVALDLLIKSVPSSDEYITYPAQL